MSIHWQALLHCQHRMLASILVYQCVRGFWKLPPKAYTSRAAESTTSSWSSSDSCSMFCDNQTFYASANSSSTALAEWSFMTFSVLSGEKYFCSSSMQIPTAATAQPSLSSVLSQESLQIVALIDERQWKIRENLALWWNFKLRSDVWKYDVKCCVDLKKQLLMIIYRLIKNIY